jgi:hypothetical protein
MESDSETESAASRGSMSASRYAARVGLAPVHHDRRTAYARTLFALNQERDAGRAEIYRIHHVGG